MSAQNPLVHCLHRLNLGDDQQLLQRAEHYHGLCSAQVSANVFSKGPNCKAVVAIQLAAESLALGNDWDTKLAAQLAGCTKSAYESAVSKVRKSLKLQPSVSLDALGVVFGCTTMVPHVKTLWDQFSSDYLSQLRGAQRVNAQEQLEQQPGWKGAVFYTCAKALGERLAKGKIQTMCACTANEMTKYLKAVEEVSKKAIDELKKESTSRPVGRRRTRGAPEKIQGDGDDKEEAEVEGEEAKEPAKKRARTTSLKRETAAAPSTRKAPPPPSQSQSQAADKTMPKSGIASMISHQDYRDTRRYHDYQAWSAALHARLEA